MIISIINNTAFSKFEVQEVIRAVNRQLQEDFKPYWHKDVQLRLEGWTGESPNPDFPLDMRGDAVIYLWDKDDPNSALGYHDLNYSGVPFGFVFTKLADEMNEPWSVTLSHEALEMAVDPEINLYATGPHPADPDRNVMHWYELCDAVQAETYEIDGIAVSNFVLPLYFTGGDEHYNHNDFLGNSLPSFGVAQGGYIGYQDPYTGETEYYIAPDDESARKRREKKERFGGPKRQDRHDLTEASHALSTRSDVRCMAITFEIATHLEGEKKPYDRASELVQRFLGSEWKLVPCKVDELEFDAEYTGLIPLDFGAAWDKVYLLEDTPAVEWAEPSFMAPVPGEFEDIDRSLPGGVRASSGGKKLHRRGTEQREWSLTLCRVQEAWDFIRESGGIPGQDVRIGHPDSGYLKHEQLDAKRLLTGIDYDFLDSDSDTRSDSGNHGLATGSVIMSGVDRVGEYVTGAAPFASLLPLRVTKPSWWRPAPVLLWGGMNRLRNAIDHAISKDCRVISISLGGLPSRAVEKAVKRARDQGVIVLAAAGNRVRKVVWPAQYEDVIAVAGCNIDRGKWSGSSRGDAVDVTAPGESVWCARIKDGVKTTGRGNGTSFATATLAGIAALWVGYHGWETLESTYGAAKIPEVFSVLMKQTASQDHQLPEGFGAGIVDALALLKADLPDPNDVNIRDPRTLEHFDRGMKDHGLDQLKRRGIKLRDTSWRELLFASALGALDSERIVKSGANRLPRGLSRTLKKQL